MHGAEDDRSGDGEEEDEGCCFGVVCKFMGSRGRGAGVAWVTSCGGW